MEICLFFPLGILCDSSKSGMVPNSLIYSWRFSRYSAPIHCLVHGQMTSNNETVSHQMAWAGNISWRQTENSSLLPAKCWPLLQVIGGGLMLSLESQRVFQNLLLFFFLCNNKSLNDWSLGEQRILFPSNLNVSLDFVSGNSLYPSGPSVKCLHFRAQLTLSSLTWPVTRVFYYPTAFCRVQITPKRVQISRSICTPEDRLDRFVCCWPIS